MADFFISEQCAIGSALDALGFSIGLSFGFPFASRNPFFTSSSVISTSWTSEVPPTYSIYIRVGNQTYLSNLFALFSQKRQTRLVSETLQSAYHFFVILNGKTFLL